MMCCLYLAWKTAVLCSTCVVLTSMEGSRVCTLGGVQSRFLVALYRRNHSHSFAARTLEVVLTDGIPEHDIVRIFFDYVIVRILELISKCYRLFPHSCSLSDVSLSSSIRYLCFCLRHHMLPSTLSHPLPPIATHTLSSFYNPLNPPTILKYVSSSLLH
jgi:hypothetical protein